MVRLQSAKMWIFALVISLVCGPGRAPGGITDPNQLFARLERLEPCDVTRATYVRLTAGRWSAEDVLPYDHTPSGNAWMLSEVRDAAGRRVKGTFVVDGGDVVEVYWSEGPSSHEDDPFRVYGTWSPALWRADVLLLTQFLRDDATARTPRADLQRGRALLFAWHLHQQGDRDTAGRIVQDLCRVGDDPDAVFIAGMNVLADAQYRSLYRGFLTDRDWARYSEGLRELMARYPRDWKSGDAMQVLLDRIAARRSGPPPIGADVNGLSEADLELAARLTSLRVVRAGPSYREAPVLWLIPSSWPDGMARRGDPDLEIRAKGLAGLPLLLALFGDGALTEADIGAVRDDRLRPLLRRKVGYSFGTLDRPATRGEVVQRILLDILPAEVTQGERGPKSGKELLASARAFYEEHRHATDEELAVLFLLRPYGALNGSAVSIVLEAARHKRVPALEKFLLAEWKHPANRATDFTEMLVKRKAELFQRYAALRGSEVTPLAGELAARLRERAEAYEKPPVSYGNPEANRKRVEEIRTRIRRAAADVEAIQYDVTLDELLTRRLKSTDSRDWVLLTTKLRAMAPSEAMAAVLRKAVEADDPAGRIAMAHVLRHVAPARDGTGLNAPQCDELWRALVTDDRQSPNNASSRVSDRFLAQHERLFGGRQTEDAERLVLDYGASGRELLRRRVLGRLSGVPEAQLPPYAQDHPLSPAERAALEEKLAAIASLEEAVGLPRSMSIYEQAALPGLLRERPDLNDRLLVAANTVVTVSAADAEPPLRDKLADWVGRPVSLELLRELQEYCKARGSADQAAFCLVARKEYFGGCEITVGSVVEGQGKEVKGVSGLACAPGVYGAADWRLAPLPEKPSWRTYRTSEADVMCDFEQALADVFGPRVEASCAALVKLQTKGGIE